MAKVSVLIPSRNERFLEPTVKGVLEKAAGDVEVVVVLDGYWPDPPLPSDDRLILIHRGQARGMRPAINAAVEVARGDYLMKLDAHCLLDEGFDEKLQADCDGDWIVVPRRYSLDAENWCIQAKGRSPIDAHFLSYPFRPDDGIGGLHGSPWNARSRERIDVLLDDELSSQGSCWFMSREHWEQRLGDMEIEHYGNFIQEFQELGLKTWLGGGQVKVNKKTWYAHLHKGKKYGRGYFISKGEMASGADFATHYWMLDKWEKRVHDLRWLIEKFAPVPTWPEDLDEAFQRARKILSQ